MRLTRCVVPDRGNPTTMIGADDLDVEDLGVAGEQVADPQTVDGVADAVAEQRQAAEGGALRVAVDLRQPQPEAGAEVVGPEVVEPGPLDGGLEHGVDGQIHRVALAVVEGQPSGSSVSSGAPQVGDADAWPVIPAPRSRRRRGSSGP